MNTIRRSASVAAVTAALTAALAGGLAACGPATSSGSTSGAASASSAATASSSSAATDPLAALSASAITAKALAGTLATTSVHVAGIIKDSGGAIKFAETVAGSKCTGSMAQGSKGSFLMTVISKTAWVKPDDTFWKASGGSDPAVLSQVTGKWLTDSTGGNLGNLVALCDLNGLFGSVKSAAPAMTKGATATVNGQRALELKDSSDGSAVYVTDTASPVLVRLVAPPSTGGSIDFTAYGAAATITPPSASQTLDGKKYGF